MGRSLKIRKARTSELRKVEELLQESLNTQQRRRAQVILLYSEGLKGVDIAAALAIHPLTVYNDLRAFEQEGLACLQPSTRGVAKKISKEQELEILRIASLEPIDVGRVFGRWSLTKLRDYLIKEHIVKEISTEHLRRLLKKGG